MLVLSMYSVEQVELTARAVKQKGGSYLQMGQEGGLLFAAYLLRTHVGPQRGRIGDFKPIYTNSTTTVMTTNELYS